MISNGTSSFIIKVVFAEAGKSENRKVKTHMHIHEHIHQISSTGETLCNLFFITHLVILRFIVLLIMCVCDAVCGSVTVSAVLVVARRGRCIQKRELELQVVMNYLLRC